MKDVPWPDAMGRLGSGGLVRAHLLCLHFIVKVRDSESTLSPPRGSTCGYDLLPRAKTPS
jgi:hypothetical protein